jgi:hypothetical protein
MASVAITVPDALVPRLLAALRDNYPQYATLPDAAAFRKATADYWATVLVGYETGQATAAATPTVAAARDQAISDAASIG